MKQNDTNTPLQKLKEIVEIISTERDWHQFHNPKNIAINMSLEANELLEKFVWSSDKDSYNTVESCKQEMQDELADVLYSILLFSYVTKIDITSAFLEKTKEIRKKYPIEKCKGKNLKYNQL